MNFLTNKIFRPFMASIMLMVFSLVGLTSCDAIYDDLEECPRGVEMRFVFDYNLEFANAFPSQVDCLTVYVFDAEGNLVTRRTETTEVLRDEDWRMIFDLPAGNYRTVAYGGMECDMTSFNHTKDVESISTIEDLDVLMNEDHIGTPDSPATQPLHDHFYGALDFVVSEGLTYDKVKVEMMRNTNNLRLVLQHVDGSPVDYKNFKFEVIDDNLYFNHNNDIVPTKEITYSPWSSGNAYAGFQGNEKVSRADDGMPVQVAYAELSMSRLIYDSAYSWTRENGEKRVGPRLRITNVNDGHTVADLPLNNYLLLMKSDYFKNMEEQEYLDRSYRHNLVFFLDSNDKYWVSLHIVVRDWTVRIDNAEF